MPSIPRIRDRSKQGWFMRLLENLRSEVRWLDLFVGGGAALLISALLLDFRYQAVPDYKVGDIAQQDLRAIQDVTFEDREATESKRRAAWIGTAALYDLDTSLLQRRAGRALQSFRPPPVGFWKRRRSLQKVRLIALSNTKSSEIFSEKQVRFSRRTLIRVLLKHRFNPALEAQIIKVLDTVLRAGVVANRAQFLSDQRTGVVVRDLQHSIEQPLSEAYIARDLVAATGISAPVSSGLSGIVGSRTRHRA